MGQSLQLPCSMMRILLLPLFFLSCVSADVWSDAGIVPTFLPYSPETEIKAIVWRDTQFKLKANNATVDSADIRKAPTHIRFNAEEDKLYLIVIVDFGVITGPTNNQNYLHWMVHNVPGNAIRDGVENIEYLTPWGFERNADETDIVETGDAALHPLGILIFEQHPRVTIDALREARGCSFDGLLGAGRTGDISNLMAKYALGDRPVAGKLFWTKYGKVADEINCYITACTGFAFPYAIPGKNDFPGCDSGDLWVNNGIVPKFLPESPAKRIPAIVWRDTKFKLKENNATVLSEDILKTPTNIRLNTDEDKLYTYMIIDFGVITGPTENQNFIHWMVHNVPGTSFSEGDENTEYLTPWGFERNADQTAIVDTGAAALHPLGILAFEQSGSISGLREARGCSFDGVFGAGRFGDVSNLMEHFNLGSQPIAGTLFWTRRSPAADAVNCYVSKCTGQPFPYPIVGYNDMPECQP